MSIFLIVFFILLGIGAAAFGGFLIWKHTQESNVEAISSISFTLTQGLIVLIIGLIIASVGPYLVSQNMEDHDSANPGPTSTSTPTPTITTSSTMTSDIPTSPTSSASPPQIIVHAPLNGAEISGAEGVTIEGSAGDLGDSTIWIFDFALNADGRRVFYRANDLPLEVTEGNWSFTDRPIGNGSSDIGEVFKIAIVEASADCTKILKNAKPNQDGDVVFPSLPAGCRQIDQREVSKNRL